MKRKFNAWQTLLTNIHGRKNPIILATEPYTNKDHLIPQINRDLTPYYYKKRDTRPRAAVVVHNSLTQKCWDLAQFTTPDLAAVKILLDGTYVILASSYMDINGQAPPPETTPLIEYAHKNKIPLIIGSDTNSHHTAWGNRDCNSRGTKLLDYLTAHNLSWSNKGQNPTFLNSRGHNSIIDLTITNDLGISLINNWHVSNLYSNSDHRYIMFDITTGPKKDPKELRLIKNTDWDEFSRILSNNPVLQHYHITTVEDIDENASKLNKAINGAFEKSCPITYISSAIKKPPWLTPEILL